MTHPMSDLPPLPEFPTGLMTVTYEIDRKVKVPVFDEHKMREYAQQAVEAERNHWYDEVQYRFGFEVADEIRARGNA